MRCLLRSPFSTLGALGLLALALLAVAGVPVETPAGTALVAVLHSLGIAFYVAANVLARHAPGIPEWLDVMGVLVLGAAPYLAADLVWRRALSRGRAASWLPGAGVGTAAGGPRAAPGSGRRDRRFTREPA